MKNFLLSIVFLSLTFTVLNADYLLQNKNQCVHSFYYDLNNSTVNYILSSDLNTLHTSYSVNYRFIPGYDYNSSSSTCSLPSVVQKLSLSSSDYNFLMALMGLLIGFAFLLSVTSIFQRGR